MQRQIQEADIVATAFTQYGWLLTLRNRTHPPQYPTHGISPSEARQIMENILWLLDLALTDEKATKHGIKPARSPVEDTLLGEQLMEFKFTIAEGDLSEQWERDNASRLRHTHAFFDHLGGLFETLQRWLAFGNQIDEVYSSAGKRYALVKSTIWDRRGNPHDIRADLQSWGRGMVSTFRTEMRRTAELHTMPLSCIPAYLIARQQIDAVSYNSRHTVYQQGNARPEKPIIEVGGRALAGNEGKHKAIHEKAKGCMLCWASTAPLEAKGTSFGKLLGALGRPPFITTKTASGKTVEKQICFPYTFEASTGCNGGFRKGTRWQACNRQHVDLVAEDWGTYTAADLAALKAFLKQPNVARLFAPTSSLVATPQWKDAS